MKKLLPLALAAVMLTGCGANVLGAKARTGAAAAQSVAGVNKGVRAMFEAAFKACDKDDSEYLTIEELPESMPAVPGQGSRSNADPSAARKELMSRLDANADGKVRYREFARAEFVNSSITIFRLVAGQLFVQMDLNGDRSLVAGEVVAAKFPQFPGGGPKFDFDALDKNSNGKLTLSEFEDGWAAMLAAGPDPVDPAPADDPVQPTEPTDPAPAEDPAAEG